jgi:hypothetical protein
VNLTDAESRIMPRSGGGGFEQSFNAQAAVDADSRLVVATNVVNTPVDAKQVEPMLERLGQLPEELGKVDKLLGDAGFFSARRTSSIASGAGSCRTSRGGVISTICPGTNARHAPSRYRQAPTRCSAWRIG